jgi:hypothetical protein
MLTCFAPLQIPFVLLAIVLLLLMMIEPFRLISVAQTLTLNWREEEGRIPIDTVRDKELQVLQHTHIPRSPLCD